MIDVFERFKPITQDDMFKGIDKSYSVLKSAYGLEDSGADQPLTWYLVDRTNENWSQTTVDDMKNLFHSFGISREDEEDWFKVFNISDWYNAKRMLIASIPQSGCGSYVDGSTLRINVPTGTTSGDYVTFYGSTFAGYIDPITGKELSLEHEELVYGGPSCYLFANTNSGANDLPVGTYTTETYHPYTGNTNGSANPNSGVTSFDPDAEATLTTHYRATHWQVGDDGRDTPYGVALLDRGLFILFDMYGRSDFVNWAFSANTLWSANTETFAAMTTTGGTEIVNTNYNNRKSIVWTGTTANTSAKVQYRYIDEEYKMIYFCHAGQSEFNSTSNNTYNHKKGYFKPEEADSLWITELGLYDELNELMAYVKLNKPVEKSKLETLTFKVSLRL